MDRQATLENETFLIRALEDTDLENLYAAANDPLLWEQHPASRYKRDVFEKFFQESLDTGGALVIIDKSLGVIVGSSRFNLIPGREKEIEIGWSFLMRKYWGGKYNASFKNLMMQHAFKTMDAVLYYVDFENIRSKMAMQKLGARLLEGDEYLKFKKQEKDHYIFIIEKKDYKF